MSQRLRDIEAERGLLSLALCRVGVTVSVGHLADDLWSVRRHRAIWQAAAALGERGGAVDLITVGEALRVAGRLPDCGGLTYLSELVSAAPAIVEPGHLVGRLREAAQRRRLVAACRAIEDHVHEEPTAEAALDLAEQLVGGVRHNDQGNDPVHVGEPIKAVWSQFEARHQHESAITGIPTGFYRLDQMLAGLHGSDLLILAARPAMGKTAFAINIAAHTSMRCGVPTAFFSLEMSKEQLGIRMMCAEGRVDAGRVRTGKLEERDWARLAAAADRLYAAPLYIDDTPGISLRALRHQCRQRRARGGLGLVIVDYLQLMGDDGQGGTREQEVSRLSRGLKALAKELNIPVIALSQLNRSLESRPIPERRPRMSDLRESGAIEQDADVILFLFRESVYERVEGSDAHLTEVKRRGAEVIVGKQRNGPIGTVQCAYVGEFTRFENVEVGYERQ